MRIGIIAASNLRYSPYIWFYTSILDSMDGLEYELVYPNRHGVSDFYGGVAHELPWNGSVPTALAYMLYARKVISVIQRQNYDAVIVLTTNNAVFLGSWLRRHYAGRFMVDIRDYTHENIRPFYYLEKKVLAASSLNVISSARFRKFLPPGEYTVCHNLPRDVEKERKGLRKINAGDSVTIGYLGTGGYMDNCCTLANLVLKDERFRMHLYGPATLESMVPENVYERSQGRICYCGSFTPDQKESVLERVDLLFNIYGNGIPLLDYALSNKLYDALCFRKPILISPNTYMAELAGPMGYAIDLTKCLDLAGLHVFLENLDTQQLNRYCEETLSWIIREQEETRQRINCQIRMFGEERDKK